MPATIDPPVLPDPPDGFGPRGYLVLARLACGLPTFSRPPAPDTLPDFSGFASDGLDDEEADR